MNDNNGKFIYYDQMLLSTFDSMITENILNISSYTYEDNYGVKPIKLKFNIANYKAGINIKFNLSLANIIYLIQQLKPLIIDLPNIQNKIKDDVSYVKTISIKPSGQKKYLYVSFLHRNEYDGICVRFVFCDKDKPVHLEKEKVFVDIYEFYAMSKILGEYRDNYIHLTNSYHNVINSKKLNNQIDNLDQKINSFYLELRNDKPVIKEEIIKTEIPNINLELDEIKEKTKDKINKDDDNDNGPQGDFNTFVDDTLDDIDLDLDVKIKSNDKVIKSKNESVKMIEDKKSFMEIFLDNNIMNIEKYSNLALTDDMSLEAFNNLIIEKYKNYYPDFKLYPNCKENEYLEINYLINNSVKYYIRELISKQEKLPNSLIPTYYELTNSSNFNSENLDIVYDSFLCMIFYAQLRNVLQEDIDDAKINKEYSCFLIKSFLSPLVFSYLGNEEVINNLNKDLFLTEIKRRYEKYLKNGVFDKLYEKLSESTVKQKYEVSVASIINTSEKLLKAFFENYNSFKLESTFEKYKDSNIITLHIDDFINNDLTNIEQIKKYISLENQYLNNGKIEEYTESIISLFSNSILKRIGLKENIKLGNQNLLRYIKDVITDIKEQEFIIQNIINKMCNSYFDLINKNISFTNLPEKILKALCIWNLKLDKKVATNYNYFLEKIKNTSLTYSMCISMLNNISVTQPKELLTDCMEIIDLKY